MERLDKILVSQGIGSRKEVQKLIRSKSVTVNSELVTKPETKLDPDEAEICVKGRRLSFKKYIYLMLHKPSGYVSATEDNLSATVMELVPKEFMRRGLAPAGRLDKDTEGLLILTDDGDFAHRLISPKSKVYKRYYAELDFGITEDDVRKFREGIELDNGEKCLSARLEKAGETSAFAEICEGKFHQIKKMFAACSKKVLYLKRVSIGGLKLDGNLPKGECRELTKTEKDALFIGI